MNVFHKILIKLLVTISILGLFYSCTFDNEEDLLRSIICDTINIDYDDLTYIFSGICADCHNSTFSYRPDIKMDSYENVLNSINTGLVLPAIKHTGPFEMPYGLPMLSECEIRQIELWINAGMPEN